MKCLNDVAFSCIISPESFIENKDTLIRLFDLFISIRKKSLIKERIRKIRCKIQFFKILMEKNISQNNQLQLIIVKII